MLNLIDATLKQFYHELGLNIVAIGPDKVPIDANGNRLSGAILHEHKPLEQHVLEAENWGLRHSTDTVCENIIFLDWDTGTILDELKKFMLTYRKKGEQDSYHGIIKVTDAEGPWCKDFVKQYGIEGLEMFAGNKNFVMFGTYQIKDSDQTATWHWIDDMKSSKKIIEVTKIDLGKIFSKKGTKITTGTVPKGQGLRHNAIVGEVFNIINLRKKDKLSISHDTVIDQLMCTQKIEQMTDYATGEKAKELQKIVEYAISHVDNDKNDLIADLAIQKHDFASIDETGEKTQFNCHVYKQEEGGVKFWSPESAKAIQTMSQRINIEGSGISSRAARAISEEISTLPNTLRITYNPDYISKRLEMTIDKYGRYFDLKRGSVHDIAPELHFYESYDVVPRLDDSVESSVLIEEFLQDRYGDAWEIVRDHHAGINLHPKIRGTKGKMLHLVGKTDTWKSFTLEVIANLYTQDSVSNVSPYQLTDDSIFGPATIINKSFNYFEERVMGSLEGVGKLKDIITKVGGSARKMRSTRAIQAWRWPVWTVAVNTPGDIGFDDEDNSVFNRFMYVETKPVPETQKDWRKLLLDEAEQQKILMYFLRRASEIRNNPSKMVTQDLSESADMYQMLRTGPVQRFIDKYYDRTQIINGIAKPVDDYIGVNPTIMWNRFKKESGINMKERTFFNELLSMGHEKTGKEWCTQHDSRADTYIVTGTTGSGQRRVTVTRLMDKNLAAGSKIDQNY